MLTRWPHVASWRCFSGFEVWRNSCSTSLARLFSDWTRFSQKKSCLFWVDRNPTLASAPYLATLLWRKDDEDYFSPKLRIRIKDNNNSPHGKFHWFLFPFSSRFSDLNFASYVLYIYLCYVACHTQWAWVTYGLLIVFMLKFDVWRPLYTVQDLVNKMKKLQQKYKQEKDKSSRSGTGKRKKWELFEIIDRTLCDISPSVFFSHFAKISISFLA